MKQEREKTTTATNGHLCFTWNIHCTDGPSLDVINVSQYFRYFFFARKKVMSKAAHASYCIYEHITRSSEKIVKSWLVNLNSSYAIYENWNSIHFLLVCMCVRDRIRCARCCCCLFVVIVSNDLFLFEPKPMRIHFTNKSISRFERRIERKRKKIIYFINLSVWCNGCGTQQNSAFASTSTSANITRIIIILMYFFERALDSLSEKEAKNERNGFHIFQNESALVLAKMMNSITYCGRTLAFRIFIQ